jgi:hypothetical protein
VNEVEEAIDRDWLDIRQSVLIHKRWILIVSSRLIYSVHGMHYNHSEMWLAGCA